MTWTSCWDVNPNKSKHIAGFKKQGKRIIDVICFKLFIYVFYGEWECLLDAGRPLGVIRVFAAFDNCFIPRRLLVYKGIIHLFAYYKKYGISCLV